ncbi:MAG: hypothetical protein DME44_08490, partial [Verrucomicrobia bacterium]
MAKLEGKIALITGGNSGIGLATAKRFVNEGAYVFITGRRKSELDAAIKEIKKKVTAIQEDVANLDDLDRLFAQMASKHRINSNGRARRRLGQSSRKRHLHCLGDSVVDHLHRNVDGRLAGNKNDATPVCRFHARQIVAREAHSAHKVCLDNLAPIIIGDLLERLRLVYAHVIDKN